MQVQCQTCSTINHLYLEYFDCTYHAFECVSCGSPDWISEEDLFEYMEEESVGYFQAMEDLDNRKPLFVSSHYGQDI